MFDSIFGVRLVTPTRVPKLHVSYKFNCSDEVRADMNKYLLDMFGTKEVFYGIGKNTLVLNARMIDDLKRSLCK